MSNTTVLAAMLSPSMLDVLNRFPLPPSTTRPSRSSNDTLTLTSDSSTSHTTSTLHASTLSPSTLDATDSPRLSPQDSDDLHAPALMLGGTSTSSSLEEDSQGDVDDISPSSPPFTDSSLPKPTSTSSDISRRASYPRPALQRSLDSTRSVRSVWSISSSPDLADVDTGYDTDPEAERSASRARGSLRRKAEVKVPHRSDDSDEEELGAGRPMLQRGVVYSPGQKHAAGSGLPRSTSPTAAFHKRKAGVKISPLATPRVERRDTIVPCSSSASSIPPEKDSVAPVDESGPVGGERSENASQLLGLGFQNIDLRSDEYIVVLGADKPSSTSTETHLVVSSRRDPHRAVSCPVPTTTSTDTPSVLITSPAPDGHATPTPCVPRSKGAGKPSLSSLRRPAHAPVTSSPLSGTPRPRSRNCSPLAVPYVPPSTPIPPGLRNSPLLKNLQEHRPRVPSAPVLSSSASLNSLAEDRMHRHALFFEKEPEKPKRLKYVVTPPPSHGRVPQDDGTQVGFNPYFMKS